MFVAARHIIDAEFGDLDGNGGFGREGPENGTNDLWSSRPASRTKPVADTAHGVDEVVFFAELCA